MPRGVGIAGMAVMGKLFSVRIGDIPREGIRLTPEWDPDSLDDILQKDTPVGQICSPVRLELSFALTGDKVILDGSCSVEVQLTCARCLEAFTWPVHSRFRYIFWPQSKQNVTAERELREDDLEIIYYDGEYVELRPLVREQILLSLPQYPRCGDTCAGLCALCGANLNKGGCTCSGSSDIGRSPFSVLKTLKNK